MTKRSTDCATVDWLDNDQISMAINGNILYTTTSIQQTIDRLTA